MDKTQTLNDWINMVQAAFWLMTQTSTSVVSTSEWNYYYYYGNFSPFMCIWDCVQCVEDVCRCTQSSGDRRLFKRCNSQPPSPGAEWKGQNGGRTPLEIKQRGGRDGEQTAGWSSFQWEQLHICYSKHRKRSEGRILYSSSSQKQWMRVSQGSESVSCGRLRF